MGASNLTLSDVVAAGARTFGASPWLIFGSSRLTYQDSFERMETSARRLSAAGVRPGDRVAMIARNRAEHLDLLFAAARIGAILIEVNWRLSADEILYVLSDTSPSVVLADGNITYVGRSAAKELIKSGGENVYPAEVEAVIRSHPGVSAVVVFGVPDPQWHEAVKAVCELLPGTVLEPSEITEHLSELLALYKRPKFVAITARLPRSACGEIDRAAVKKTYT